MRALLGVFLENDGCALANVSGKASVLLNKGQRSNVRPNSEDLNVDPVGNLLSVLVGLRSTLSDSTCERSAVNGHNVGLNKVIDLHSIKAATGKWSTRGCRRDPCTTKYKRSHCARFFRPVQLVSSGEVQ